MFEDKNEEQNGTKRFHKALTIFFLILDITQFRSSTKIPNMNLQYISDRVGKITAVQIPIDEWDEIKRKYKGLDEDEQTEFIDVPDWHIPLLDKELEKIANGTAGLLEWDEVKSQFIV